MFNIASLLLGLFSIVALAVSIGILWVAIDLMKEKDNNQNEDI